MCMKDAIKSRLGGYFRSLNVRYNWILSDRYMSVLFLHNLLDIFLSIQLYLVRFSRTDEHNELICSVFVINH